MKISYTIQYNMRLFAKMSVGYYAYISKGLLIKIPVVGLLLFFCYPNSFDPQFQLLFFIVGVLLGDLGRVGNFLSAALGSGFWEIVKRGDGKVDFTLSDQSIVRESKLAKMEYDWTLLFRIVETKSYLFLILRNHGYVPVPKTVLTQESNAWLDGKLVHRKSRRRREPQVPTTATQSKGIRE
jgi:hypothetical protein